jgi:hypothetical protein
MSQFRLFLFIYLLLQSGLSCKTRCLEGVACSNFRTDDAGSPHDLKPLPWSEDMSADELLKNSNEIYGELARRFALAGDSDFLVPEFEPTIQEMSKYWDAILQSWAENSPAERRWRLKALGQSLEAAEQQLKDEAENPDTLMVRLLLLGADYRSASADVNAYNESLSLKCLSERFETWKGLAYRDGQVTYSSFWKAFTYFGYSISSACSKQVKRPFELGNGFRFGCLAAGFCLPVFLKESSFADFNAITHVPLSFVGMIDRAMIVDEVAMLPDRFVSHDFAHAQDKMSLSSTHVDTFFPGVPYTSYAEEGRPPGVVQASVEWSQIQSILIELSKRREENACILVGIAQSESQNALETLYFYYTHEASVNVDLIPRSELPSPLPKRDREGSATRIQKLVEKLKSKLGFRSSSWEQPAKDLANIVRSCIAKT